MLLRTGPIAAWVESEYSSWLSGDVKNLWIKGVSGTGKSTLISSLIESLKARGIPNTQKALVYTYLEKNSDDVDLLSLMASMLKQIAQCSLELSEDMSEFYKYHATAKAKPRMSEYRSMLRKESKNFDTVFIVLDALDRGKRTVVANLLGELRELRGGVATVKLLTSSLDIPDFRLELGPQVKLDDCRHDLKDTGPIESNLTAKDEDIKVFIDKKISYCPPSSAMSKYLALSLLKNKGLREEIDETVLRKSQGM